MKETVVVAEVPCTQVELTLMEALSPQSRGIVHLVQQLFEGILLSVEASVAQDSFRRPTR